MSAISVAAIRNTFLYAREMKREKICILSTDGVPPLKSLHIAATLFVAGVIVYDPDPVVCDALRAIIHLDWLPEKKATDIDNRVERGFQIWCKRHGITSVEGELDTWCSTKQSLANVTIWHGVGGSSDGALNVDDTCVLVDHHQPASTTANLPIFIWSRDVLATDTVSLKLQLAIGRENKGKTLSLHQKWDQLLRPPPPQQPAMNYPGPHNGGDGKKVLLKQQKISFGAKPVPMT